MDLLNVRETKVRRFEDRIAIQFNDDLTGWTPVVYIRHADIPILADNLREVARDITKREFADSQFTTRFIPPRKEFPSQ
jgi:hypothetical protein